MKKSLLVCALCAMLGICLGMLAGCSQGSSGSSSDSVSTSKLSTGKVSTSLSKIDMSKWKYDSDNNVYYQTGISYCASPADTTYETMGIYIPGKYMKATSNGDGTYTCKINSSAKIGSYTAKTAPIIVPVNTPGYSAQSAPAGYDSSTSDYTKAGFVVVLAGCRGRDAGAPAGVTDLKAAIRYTRYNSGVIPGDTDSVFSEGMSGGGAQSAVLGASGDSALYDKYLKAIGAVTGVSDAVEGSMCWCPITSLDYADEAYEWCMGSTRSGLSSTEQTLSNDMAKAYAKYINALKLKDSSGNTLTLSKSKSGEYQAGSYYKMIKKTVEKSLDNFLKDTTFPYTAGSSGSSSSASSGGSLPSGSKPSGSKPSGSAPSGSSSAGAGSSASTGTVSLSGTYKTAQDYINALNADTTWVKYDKKTNTVKITSLSAFVKAMKTASKGIGAFDQLDAGQTENTLFGYGNGTSSHFDTALAKILKDTGSSYATAYSTALKKKDSEGNTVTTRVNMYNPMYYLSDYYSGYKKSNVAKYWRIRTGISQSDTSLTTEVNLALAAKNYSDDTNVDFATVWGQGHTQAERTGTSTDNFIKWVKKCTAA